MAGKSSITRLPPMVKAYIQKLLREDRMTLDSMLADIQSRFPNEKAPSRSALGRFKFGFDELTEKARAQREMAEAFVGAFGEDASDKTGVLLVEAISTLTYQAAMEARTMSVKERLAVEKAARERLLQEQAAELDSAVKTQGMTEDQAMFWRQKFLGL